MVGRSCPAMGKLHGPRKGAAAWGPRRSPGEGQAGGAVPSHKMQSSGPAFRRGVGHTSRLCSPRLSAGSGTAGPLSVDHQRLAQTLGRVPTATTSTAHQARRVCGTPCPGLLAVGRLGGRSRGWVAGPEVAAPKSGMGTKGRAAASSGQGSEGPGCSASPCPCPRNAARSYLQHVCRVSCALDCRDGLR